MIEFSLIFEIYGYIYKLTYQLSAFDARMEAALQALHQEYCDYCDEVILNDFKTAYT